MKDLKNIDWISIFRSKESINILVTELEEYLMDPDIQDKMYWGEISNHTPLPESFINIA